MDERMTKLEGEVEELKKIITNLGNSSMLDRNIENALTERIGGAIGTTTAGATTVVSSVPFNLPANPTGALAFTWKGVTYNLLYK